MINLGLQRRWAGRPGAIERAKKRLAERATRKQKKIDFERYANEHAERVQEKIKAIRSRRIP